MCLIGRNFTIDIGIPEQAQVILLHDGRYWANYIKTIYLKLYSVY